MTRRAQTVRPPLRAQKHLIQIVEAISPTGIAQVRLLFEEYAASLGVDLCFQGFEEEVKSLPGKYAPPEGGLFLALSDGQPVGCVALRPLNTPDIAELKRLYVRPHARGSGLGRSLTQQAIERAITAGYDRIRLDTLPMMEDAQRLYRKLGFREIAAYTFNPVPGVTYMELILHETGTA